MPRRNRDNFAKFLSNTPTASNNQPSLFFGGYELEKPLGGQTKIYEEPTGQEEEEELIPTDPMAENRNNRWHGERV